MWRNPYDSYLEDRILSADPVELVHLLYQGCGNSIADARRYLAEGDIALRARSISRACDILMELAGSLDHARGGAISRQLAQLYGYMHRRLIDANFQQSDAELAEVALLIETLQEGWEGVRSRGRREINVETPWIAAMAQPELAHASSGWSF